MRRKTRKLKQLVADLSLDKQILQHGSEQTLSTANLVSASCRLHLEMECPT